MYKSFFDEDACLAVHLSSEEQLIELVRLNTGSMLQPVSNELVDSLPQDRVILCTQYLKMSSKQSVGSQNQFKKVKLTLFQLLPEEQTVDPISFYRNQYEVYYQL